jgi:signal transduction histidine kinase/CheY-like chemotaxis protein
LIGLIVLMHLTGYVSALYVLAVLSVAFVAQWIALRAPKMGAQGRLGWVAGSFFMIGCLTAIHVGYAPGPMIGFTIGALAAATLGSKRLVWIFVILTGLAISLLGWFTNYTSGALLIEAEYYKLDNPVVWYRFAFVVMLLLTIPLFLIGAIKSQLRKSRKVQEDSIAAIEKEQEQKQLAENKRRQTEQALFASQKLELVGHLAAGLAHEYNNQLLVMMAWTDLLQRSRKEEDWRLSENEFQEGFQHIQRAANQSAQLTRSLLALKGADSLGQKKQEVCAIDKEIQSHMSTIRGMVPEDIALEFAAGAGVGVGVGMGAQALEQVLLNLALNARDASSEGGRITIRTRLDSHNWVNLEVADTGQGMEPDTVKHIFEPAFTTNRSQGIGLGITVVAALVREEGGKITVESTPGQGSTFRVRLPTRRMEAKGVSENQPMKLVDSKTVLLAEDDDAARKILARALKSAGYTVLEADSVKRGLEVIRRQQGHIDVLCADGIMPGIGSRHLVEGFCEQHPHSPVLLIAGHLDDELLRRGVTSGRYHFLPKPFKGRELISKLNQVVQEGEVP